MSHEPGGVKSHPLAGKKERDVPLFTGNEKRGGGGGERGKDLASLPIHKGQSSPVLAILAREKKQTASETKKEKKKGKGGPEPPTEIGGKPRSSFLPARKKGLAGSARKRAREGKKGQKSNPKSRPR